MRVDQLCTFDFPRIPLNESKVCLPDCTLPPQDRIKAQRRVKRLRDDLDKIETGQSDPQDLPISQQELLSLMTKVVAKPTLFTKRRIQDVYINDYIKTISDLTQSNMDAQLLLTVKDVAEYVCKYVSKTEPIFFKEELAPEYTDLNILTKIISESACREVSLQEASFYLAGRIPIHHDFHFSYFR